MGGEDGVCGLIWKNICATGAGQFSSHFCPGLTLGKPWEKKSFAPLEFQKWGVSLAPLEVVGWVASVEVVCVDKLEAPLEMALAQCGNKLGLHLVGVRV